MLVAFCGHGEVGDKNLVRAWLKETLEELIEEGADEFYLGGYGEFDRLSLSVVNELKIKYPHLASILVLAYLNRNVDTSGYDSTTYPPIETAPYRYAILHRNRWTVDSCDVVVAYITHDWGGAAQMFQYAKRKGKRILDFK